MMKVSSFIAIFAAFILGACSSDGGEVYPNLVTEFADMYTDRFGSVSDFRTDAGVRYAVSNTNIEPLRPDTTYRVVVGYVPEVAAASSSAAAHIYTLTGAYVLADSTAVVSHDPTGVESVWLGGSYINMQLTPKTQGGVHYFGYAVDSLCAAGTAGRLHSHHHLSLHHHQAGDPLSYSATRYASVALSSIPQYTVGDTLSLTVHTFTGNKVWIFRPGAE